MIRRLTTRSAVALSTLLCAASLALGVRSYFVGEIIHLAPGPVVDTTPSAPMQGATLSWRRQYSIHSGAGKLQLVRRELQDPQPDSPGRVVQAPRDAVMDMGPMTRTDLAFSGGGFGYLRRDKQPYSRPPVTGWYWGFRVISVPYWSIVLVTGAGPALWFASYVRHRRRRLRALAHLCPSCGYDLRATPGRCPECGSIGTGPALPAS